MPPFSFCGASYTAISQNIDDERAMNLYCEKSESAAAKTPMSMLLAPGKKVFTSLVEVSVPALETINGRTFAAVSKFYEINAAGAKTIWGDLQGIPTRPTQIQFNETQALILNNGKLFVFVLASNTFTPVNMAQFDGPVSQIGFADGYFIATIQNSHKFQVSNLEDGTTWNGLNIATVSLFPDNFTSMICAYREIWFYSGKKTAAYYNAGAGFPPFIPIQGAYMEFGSGATFATVKLSDSLFWLDQDERGIMVARRAVGYGEKRVSTHAVEAMWQSYARTDDAVGFTYQMNGHEFWEILFPTAQATWVYDATTDLWHERGSWIKEAGKFGANRAMCHTFNFGKHLIGDASSGNIYQMSSSIYDDAGKPLRWLRRVPLPSSENKWMYYGQVEFDVQLGDGPNPPLLDGNGQPRPPQLLLRWSRDAGKNWSSDHWIDCGASGEYGHRAVRRFLGRGRKGVIEASGTDPVPWYFANAYLQYSQGQS